MWPIGLFLYFFQLYQLYMERDIFASPVEPLFNHDYALEKEILQDWLINLARKNARNINESHPQQVWSQFIIPPANKVWWVYSDPYVLSFVRPSQSLIHYSS